MVEFYLYIEIYYIHSLQTPDTEDEWLQIAQDFQHKWQFPNCLGAVDGKHINIVPPPNSGSTYYNYKGNNSIVLLAVVDANYAFTYVDVGVNGRVSDGGVWGNCSLRKKIDDGNAGIPTASKLPNSNKVLPYVFIGDDAFPLKTYLLKPFPYRNLSAEQRIFSYRLSRARRIVENSFGILAARFRIFQITIKLDPDKIKSIVLACIVLHNLMRRHTPQDCADRLRRRRGRGCGLCVHGSWRISGGELTPFGKQRIQKS